MGYLVKAGYPFYTNYYNYFDNQKTFMLNFVHDIDEFISVDKRIEKRYTVYSERPIKQEE